MPSYTLRDHANNVTLPQMPVQRVALHLLTDFRPWAAPPGAHLGFIPFVSSMISMSQRSRWETHRDLEYYEKQWRPVVSWLIGSAFSREAIDLMGWSAAIPVSVLASSHAKRGPWPKYLAIALRLASVRVKRKRKGLMPDYLAVPTGTGPFAFFESKGGRHPTIARQSPGKTLTKNLKAWTQQVCNAELILNGQAQRAERWISATRVHPGSRSRATYVRLWKVACPKKEGSEGEVDVPSDEDSSKIETDVVPRARSVAAGAALSRAITLHQLGLDAAAETLAIAASRLGSEFSARRFAGMFERGRAELASLQRVSAADEKHVRRIGSFAFGRKGPRLHLGLLQSGLEEIELLTRAAIDTSDEKFAAWLERPPTHVRDFIVDGVPASARADGFVAWIESS